MVPRSCSNSATGASIGTAFSAKPTPAQRQSSTARALASPIQQARWSIPIS